MTDKPRDSDNNNATTDRAENERADDFDADIRVPEEVKLQFNNYKVWQRYWYFIHYACGVVAIICGGFATASGTSNGPDIIQSNTWLWGLLASLLSSVVTFLGPLQKAETYKLSYYLLYSAVTKYKVGLLTVAELMDALNQAQTVVLTGAHSDRPQS